MANMANDTMTEGLKKLLGQIGQLMSLPDSDSQFLTGLQMGIADFLKGQYDVEKASQQQNQGQGPAMPSPAMSPNSAPMTGGQLGMGGIQPPNPDELSRLLGGALGATGGVT